MENQNVNIKALNDVYKNAHIALQSLSDILPETDDASLKKELRDEYKGYKSFIADLSSFLKDQYITPKDINGFKKAMMLMAVKMKTFINNSKNHITEMMIKGTVMGINELKAMDNEKQNYDDKTKEFIKRLLALEEEYESRLKEFL